MACKYRRCKILDKCFDRHKKSRNRRYFDSLYGRTYRTSRCSKGNFPETHIQHCIVYMLRNSTNFVSYKDLKTVFRDLKEVYSAINAETGHEELEEFGKNRMINIQ